MYSTNRTYAAVSRRLTTNPMNGTSHPARPSDLQKPKTSKVAPILTDAEPQRGRQHQPLQRRRRQQDGDELPKGVDGVEPQPDAHQRGAADKDKDQPLDNVKGPPKAPPQLCSMGMDLVEIAGAAAGTRAMIPRCSYWGQ